MHVYGSGFTATSVIMFNGGVEPTTRVSATELTTIVKPSLATVPVVVPVWVEDTTTHAVSERLSFEFTTTVMRHGPAMPVEPSTQDTDTSAKQRKQGPRRAARKPGDDNGD
jgi:hypothetical protein